MKFYKRNISKLFLFMIIFNFSTIQSNQSGFQAALQSEAMNEAMFITNDPTLTSSTHSSDYSSNKNFLNGVQVSGSESYLVNGVPSPVPPQGIPSTFSNLNFPQFQSSQFPSFSNTNGGSFSSSYSSSSSSSATNNKQEPSYLFDVNLNKYKCETTQITSKIIRENFDVKNKLKISILDEKTNEKIDSPVLGFDGTFHSAKMAQGFGIGVYRYVLIEGVLYSLCERFCTKSPITPIKSFKIKEGYKVTLLKEIILSDFVGVFASDNTPDLKQEKTRFDIAYDNYDVSAFYIGQNMSITLAVTKTKRYKLMQEIYKFSNYIFTFKETFFSLFELKAKLKLCKTNLSSSLSLHETIFKAYHSSKLQCSNLEIELENKKKYLSTLESQHASSLTPKIDIKLESEYKYEASPQIQAEIEASTKITNEITKIETDEAKITETLHTQTSSFEEVTSGISKIDVDIIKINSELNNFDLKIKEYEENLKTYLTKIQNINTEIASKTDEIKNEKLKIDALNENLKKIQLEYDNFIKSKPQLEPKQAEHKTLTKKLIEKRTELKKIEGGIADNNNKKEEIIKNKQEKIEIKEKLEIKIQKDKIEHKEKYKMKLVEEHKVSSENILNQIQKTKIEINEISSLSSTCASKLEKEYVNLNKEKLNVETHKQCIQSNSAKKIELNSQILIMEEKVKVLIHEISSNYDYIKPLLLDIKKIFENIKYTGIKQRDTLKYSIKATIDIFTFNLKEDILVKLHESIQDLDFFDPLLYKSNTSYLYKSNKTSTTVELDQRVHKDKDKNKDEESETEKLMKKAKDVLKTKDSEKKKNQKKDDENEDKIKKKHLKKKLKKKK